MKKACSILFFILILQNIQSQNKIKISIAQYRADLMSKEILSENAQIIIKSGINCYKRICPDQPEESFFFIKEGDDKYKIRYLKYLQSEDRNEFELLRDTIFYDDKIKVIFEIENRYRDSILKQIDDMWMLFALTDIDENGETIYADTRHLKFGILRTLTIMYSDNLKTLSSKEQVFDLNQLFDKAYYYWLLHSAINNYIMDHLPFRLE